MAHMYPTEGPKAGAQSNAERKLYAVLRALPEDWHVVHGAERFTKAGNGKLVRGEIDFLILHPAYGVLVIEVKGGRIGYDAATGRWTSTDHANVTHPLTPTPFAQADDAVRFLKTFIKRTPELASATYPLARAIWLYDSEWEPRHLLEFPDELILDRRSLAEPQRAIEAAFAYSAIKAEPQKLTPAAMRLFIERLVPTFAPATLSDAIRLDHRLIELLTDEQCTRLVGLLQTQRQCAIPGEAGTGKTILAFETARLLSRARWRTLFVCVNAFQAQWLKEKQEAECDVANNEQFDIFDITELCSHYAAKARLGDAGIAADQVVEAKGQNQMARVLQRGIERLRSRAGESDDWRYDAVLIDEGQDIEKPLLSALSHLLRDPRQGYFCIWYDPFQRLDFEGGWEMPFALHTTPPLTQNLRNSRPVWDAMAAIRPDLKLFAFPGPDGRAITFIDPQMPPHDAQPLEAATQDILRDLLRELVSAQGVAPSDIMLITCRTDRASQWKRWRDALTDDVPLRALTQLRQTKDEERARYVRFSTIRASKGLESDIVILVELDGIGSTDDASLPTLRRRDKLLYVAISRARHGLYVVGPPTALAPLAPAT